MKRKICLLVFAMMLCLASVGSKAATLSPWVPMDKEAIAKLTPEEKQARIDEIKARVAEIKAMDKSQLTKEERKELRTELRQMKRETNKLTGLFLSAGAVLLIIVVLILIL